MSTPATSFSGPAEYREVNRRMAEAILAADPDPYVDGGYVRRVADIRGRRSGQVHAVPIAVVSLAGCQYLVSPTRERNWVRNLLADPACTVRSRDAAEARRAVLVEDTGLVADVVGSYLARMNAPWAVAQFPFPADAPRAQIQEAADRVAVFHLQGTVSDD